MAHAKIRHPEWVGLGKFHDGFVWRLKGEGVSVLLVEQNPLAALAAADRVYVMDKGRIVHSGPARALAQDTALRTRLLGV